MNSKESTFLETDDLVQAGQVILSHLCILSDSKRYMLASHMERANYRAVRNWLTKYQPKNKVTNLENTRGFLESFYNLLMLRRSLKFWQKASLKQANFTRFKALIACNPT